MKLLLTLFVVASFSLSVVACTNPDKSRDDAQDTLLVDHTAPEVIQFNNHYPNVETKCDGHGHRLFVLTHDSAVGRNVLVITDASCPGLVENSETMDAK